VGRYFINVAGSNNYTLTLELENVYRTGTYPLGVEISMFGGYGFLTDPDDSWLTPTTGNAGEVVITELTATRMVGTFHFTVEEGPGTAPSTHAVTQGEFDLPVTGPYGVADPDMGSSFSANIGSTIYFYQVAPVLVGGAAPQLMIVAYSPDGIITIALSDFTQTTGTVVYPTSTSVPIRTIALGQTAGGWTTAVTGGSGSVNLTVTADRFSGTFTAQVVPTGGGGPARAISGTFSIGRASP
jgi:hypothetical protein